MTDPQFLKFLEKLYNDYYGEDATNCFESYKETQRVSSIEQKAQQKRNEILERRRN